MIRTLSNWWIIILLTVCLFFCCFLSLLDGPIVIPLESVVSFFLGEINEDDIETVILYEIRLPRIILAALVGAALAQSGAVMQSFFQNPMADPYIVGVSSGAGLGATTAFVLGANTWYLGVSSVTVFAFIGALLVISVVYAISRRGGRLPIATVLLTGIAIGALTSATTSFLMISGENPFDMQRIVFWLMGSFASRGWEHVSTIWLPVLVAATYIQLLSKEINILLQGEETALYLGVNVERIKRRLLISASVLTAAAVSVSGIIGFVGLVIPHLMRFVVGSDQRWLSPSCLLSGAILMVLSDWFARALMGTSEIPVGIVTAFLGCPFFIYLLGRRKKSSF